MKLKITKEYELNDIVFINDTHERENLINQIHPISLFGEITGMDKSDEDNILYQVNFLSEDGMEYTAVFPGDDILEWADFLYDMGPVTIASKYGQDIADNFAQRGLFFKDLRRSARCKTYQFERGDIVFDLDPKAENWFDAYIARNDHQNVFGVVEYVGEDSVGAEVYVVNYGEDIGYNRYSYQISTIDRFPRKDDPWSDEYKFTRSDNNMMDMYLGGAIEEYKAQYLEALDKQIEESGNSAPITNTPVLEPPKEEPVKEEVHEEDN